MSIEDSPHRCGYCELMYLPERGYARFGVEPGTSFDDLPQDFFCPECGAKLKWFEPCPREAEHDT